MILWAMDLTTAALRAESACRPRRPQNHASNPNGIYDVALNPLFPQSLSETLSQMIENTKRQGEGGKQLGELAHPAWRPPPRKV
jgi:hypothetical protein